jgi:lactate dehydrogenase-like 2-hydroxyacid dehydrogenase
MAQVDLLMPVPLPPLVQEGLAKSFRLIRLWREPDQEATLAAVGPGLRFIATGVPILAQGVSRPIDAAFLARFPRLELVANLGVGYDNIDVGACAARRVIVTNTPDVLTEETADTAFGLLLCAIRQFPQADRYLRAGKWLEAGFPLTASLRDRTMGIVGLGRIGRAIARRGEAFGLKIAYHGRKPQTDAPWPYYERLEDMARACDILMVAIPGGPSTRNLIDAPILDALGPQGVLINIARGTVVDEPALIDALREGRILTAGLDVFAGEPQVPAELIAMDHVALLPHVGSASHATRDAMSALVVDNALSFAAGRGPLTPIAETPWLGRAEAAH